MCHPHKVHTAYRSLFVAFVAQHLINVEQKIDIALDNAIVKGVVRRIVGELLAKMVRRWRVALRPPAIGVLRFEHKVQCPQHGCLVFRRPRGEIQVHQKTSRVCGHLIVKGGVAIVVVVFLKTPAFSAHLLIPLQSALRIKVDKVVPTAGSMLAVYQSSCRLLGAL